MLKTNYSVAIIGYGGMGQEHHKKINDVTCMSVVGSYDTDETKHHAIRLAGIHTYESFTEVLNDTNVDIVLIATPNDSHHIIALQALNAGKHVICEKPVMLNSHELVEIISAAERNERVFMVHQNRRWDEDYLIMKKIIEDNTIGNVFHIESRVHGSRGIPSDWRHLKEQGGGMLLDWGVHLVDRLLQMVPSKVNEVYASLSYILGHNVDDGARIYLTFENGVTALVEVGTTNFITLPKWYLNGLAGSAVIDDWGMTGKVVQLVHSDGRDAKPIEAGAGLTKTMAPRIDDSVREIPLVRIESDVREFYYNFVGVIEGREDALIKNTEVLRVMRLLECAEQSHKTKQVIKFE